MDDGTPISVVAALVTWVPRFWRNRRTSRRKYRPVKTEAEIGRRRIGEFNRARRRCDRTQVSPLDKVGRRLDEVAPVFGPCDLKTGLAVRRNHDGSQMRRNRHGYHEAA